MCGMRQTTRGLLLWQNFNEAMNKLTAAVDMNTKAVEQLVNLLGRNDYNFSQLANHDLTRHFNTLEK